MLLDPVSREWLNFNSFNIAPMKPVVTCRAHGNGKPLIELIHCGLVPPWSNDMKWAPRVIIARAETTTVKPSSRVPIRKQRCTIPTNGFYEWKKAEKTKQRYFFRSAIDELFAFASVWEQSRGGDGLTIRTHTILTTEANRIVRQVHGRMPVILSPDAFDTWLDSSRLPVAATNHLLRPRSLSPLMAYPVSTLVNGAHNDEPRCVESLGELLGSVGD